MKLFHPNSQAARRTPCRFAVLLALLFSTSATCAGEPIAVPTVENVRGALEAAGAEGVRIDAVVLSGSGEIAVSIEGRVKLNSQLSNFMRWIDASGTFHAVELIGLKDEKKRDMRFLLHAKLTRPPPSETTPAPAIERKAHRCIVDGREVFQREACDVQLAPRESN